LKLEDFSVFYKPARVSFPFKKLELNKKAGDANFSLISSTWKKNHNYKIKGGLEKLPELLFDLNGGQAKSIVEVHANKLGWTDFLDLFGENGYLKNDKPKSEREKKKSMKEMARGIHHNFQPRLLIKVDTLIYDENLQFHDFSTGLHFESDHLLILENTVFNYDNGTVSLNAVIDISDPSKTPFEFELHTEKLNLKKLLPKVNFFTVKLLKDLNDLPHDVEIDVKQKGIWDDEKGLIPNTSTGEIDFNLNKGKSLKGNIKYKPDPLFVNADNSFVNTIISLEGDPVFFNNFFKTDQFFFSKGRFFVDLDFAGEVTSMSQLLNASNATVEIKDSEVYYKAVDISFPLTKIDMKLSKDNADFNFYLNSDLYKQEILFSGGIENISELVIGNTGKQLKTNALVKSPLLTWDNFLYLFGSGDDTTNDYTPEKDNIGSNIDGMKKTITGILNTFDPSLQIRVDAFIYSDKLKIKNFETGIHLTESGKLVLEKTVFNFLNGRVGMDGTIDIGKEKTVPFDVNFRTNELDLAALLKSLDYLSILSLQNIEKLSGKITLNLDFEGILQEEGKGLLTESTKGLLDFRLYNVELQGFAPLDSIAMKIKRAERFGNLKFAPISNQVRITGNELEFPIMEVQSNAINLFAEGTFSFEDKTNIWISVPINNIKSRDLELVPEKTGYADANKKVFVEVETNAEGVNKFKFHLSKRKFYKDRGILDQFKEDKQSFREERSKKRKKKWWKKKG